MRRSLRIGYLAHSLRSDWNNGNAHFLRGLVRALGAMGHEVTVFEPEREWSVENLRLEAAGDRSLAGFAGEYRDIRVRTYGADADWTGWLAGLDVVVLHEWNPAELAWVMLGMRERVGFALVFHDTHHRASSTPEQMERFGLARFDGIVAFGESLAAIYRERWGLERVWTLHEAADVSVFRPLPEEMEQDVVWVGNWGEGERAAELREFLVEPVRGLKAMVYGVRYPAEGLRALAGAGIRYRGYLPNLEAAGVYGRARMTLHVPRQQYSGAMTGIPTIRVFEALACRIPLLSAPWVDAEGLFRAGDFRLVRDGEEMGEAIRWVIREPEAAGEMAARGLETVLSRHTCGHRAVELTEILEEVLG